MNFFDKNGYFAVNFTCIATITYFLRFLTLVFVHVLSSSKSMYRIIFAQPPWWLGLTNEQLQNNLIRKEFFAYSDPDCIWIVHLYPGTHIWYISVIQGLQKRTKMLNNTDIGILQKFKTLQNSTFKSQCFLILVDDIHICCKNLHSHPNQSFYLGSRSSKIQIINNAVYNPTMGSCNQSFNSSPITERIVHSTFNSLTLRESFYQSFNL